MARVGHSLAGYSHDPDFTPSALNSPYPHYTTPPTAIDPNHARRLSIPDLPCRPASDRGVLSADAARLRPHEASAAVEQRHPLAYRRHVGRHRHAARGLHLGDESGAPAAVRPRPRHPGLEAGVKHLRAAPPPPRRRPFPPWHRSRASTSTTPARASPKASPTARTCATARLSARRAASSPRRARRTPAGARRTLSTPRTSSACAQAIGWEAASSTLS